MPDKPVQHTPKHLQGDVFDEKHPAASAFAPLQPAAGVVADDVEEKGQNLAGGPPAHAASQTHANQRELLAKQHQAALRATIIPADPPKVEGDTATPSKPSKASK